MCRWKGLRTGTLRVGETTSKAPALYSYPFALLNTRTLSTEVRFAVPLNRASLVNDWPTIGSARTTGWRPHSECGDRLPSQRVIVTVTDLLGPYSDETVISPQLTTRIKKAVDILCTNCQRIAMTSATIYNLISNQV